MSKSNDGRRTVQARIEHEIGASVSIHEIFKSLRIWARTSADHTSCDAKPLSDFLSDCT